MIWWLLLQICNLRTFFATCTKNKNKEKTRREAPISQVLKAHAQWSYLGAEESWLISPMPMIPNVSINTKSCCQRQSYTSLIQVKCERVCECLCVSVSSISQQSVWLSPFSPNRLINQPEAGQVSHSLVLRSLSKQAFLVHARKRKFHL